ncbi:MAG TPA: sensor histidine kinase [Flavobacteriales bacterium]|nr:sensor histidine kinase [Flavobacteriales bacterium]HIO71744.1 sensor histidine kinase [Flavobacteriales bacterium]
MKAQNEIYRRYKQAMIPALIMGVNTNIYIIAVLLFVGAYEILFCPIIGTIVFLICFFLLRSNIIEATQSFLIAGYTVAVEVSIHTYALGWDSGFIYFMFLLPIVFLLNSTWKIWMTLFFNGSIAILTFVLFYICYDGGGAHFVAPETLSFISLLNLSGTGIVVFVIMLYFSRTINKKDESLIVANIELERQNKEIFAQNQHQQTLVKEIHHRVKNNLQIISSLISLQERTVKDKEVIAVLNESRRRIQAIALIHQKLYQDNKVDRVDFKSYLADLMESQQQMTPNVKCQVEASDIMLQLDTAVPLGLIISEMITNSIKHAFEGVDSPELQVLLVNSEGYFEVTVQDNGIGLPENFNLQSPLSLGTEIILALSDQINARLEYFNDNGAKFNIRFQEQPFSN